MSDNQHQECPKRITAYDFAGKSLTLSTHWSAWDKLTNGPKYLILGLGPLVFSSFPKELLLSEVFWFEDEFLVAYDPKLIPELWRRVGLDELPILFGQCTVWFYRLNLKLKPRFWGELLGSLWAQTLNFRPKSIQDSDQPSTSHKEDLNFLNNLSLSSTIGVLRSPSYAPILLSGDAFILLNREIGLALKELGYEQIIPLNSPSAEGLCDILGGKIPKAAITINALGLDPEGRIFYLLKALHVPVAIWFVDNPWHILSQFKLPWWQEANLFVTDPSFIPKLKELGAGKVYFLPLAVAQHMWLNLPESLEEASSNNWGKAPPLFVGRLAFPAKEKFFAAAHLPDDLKNMAAAMLKSQQLPHIHWWYDKLKPKFWPGHEVRLAGAGAEWAAQANRVRWMQEGLKLGFRIIGDQTWKSFFPNLDLIAPVDYYTTLPHLYYQASCVLNVTSLQLPAGLNQRHLMFGQQVVFC